MSEGLNANEQNTGNLDNPMILLGIRLHMVIGERGSDEGERVIAGACIGDSSGVGSPNGTR